MLFTVGRDIGALDAAETAIKELLLSASFELRALATNILAAASLLSSHPCIAADAEAEFLVSAINSSCNLLLNLVSNMIEMNKLERGELALHTQPFSIRAALHDVLQACAMGRGDARASVSWVNEEAVQLPELVEVRQWTPDAMLHDANARALRAG